MSAEYLSLSSSSSSGAGICAPLRMETEMEDLDLVDFIHIGCKHGE